MHTVQVTKNGVGLGTVRFRGIAAIVADQPGQRREFKCSPKGCVPKNIVGKIADRLSFGVKSGQESEYEWHT